MKVKSFPFILCCLFLLAFSAHAETYTTAPSIPASFTVTIIGATQLNLAWASSTDNVGVVGYKIERCQGSTTCTNYVNVATTTQISYKDEWLLGNTNYRYRIRAYDAAGNNSGYSNIASSTTKALDTTRPSTVTGVVATPFSATWVRLTWASSTDNIGVVGYKVYRCTGASCTPTTFVATTTVLRYDDDFNRATTTIRYRVKAFDARFNESSSYSSTAQGITKSYGVSATNAPATISVNTTWTSGTYVVTGTTTINANKRLTINPGVKVKFNGPNAGFVVNGGLATFGVSTSTVMFTSMRDDATVGDTNNDGATTTAIGGDWKEINIGTTGSSTLNWTNIYYGGYAGNTILNTGKLYTDQSTLMNGTLNGVKMTTGTTTLARTTITGFYSGVYATGGTGQLPLFIANSNIHHNTTGVYTFSKTFIDFSDIHDNTYGVWIKNGYPTIKSSNIYDNSYGVLIDGATTEPMITSNSISGNSQYGILNNTIVETYATYNYWGNADGPHCFDIMRLCYWKSGDNISDNVTYDNYLPEPHYLWTQVEGLIKSSSQNNTIRLKDTFNFGLPLFNATTTWNNANVTGDKVTFVAITTNPDLQTASTTRTDVSYVAQWIWSSSDVDLLDINHFFYDKYTTAGKQGIFTHELGHSLGLGHSNSGNVMYWTDPIPTTSGSQDLWDYQYLINLGDIY